MIEPLLDISAGAFLQYGFASVSVVLFSILIWLIRALLNLQSETNKIIERNSNSIDKNTLSNNRIIETQNKQSANIDLLKERLISRPCISKHEQQG